MNAPNRFELYILQDGEAPLEITDDTKIPNAATIKIVKQDHTVANLIRSQLLSHPNVLFAGYKVPHPLEPYFILKIQTDGNITPTAAFQTACNNILATIVNLQKEFKREFEFKEMDLDDATIQQPVGGAAAARTTDPYGVESRGTRMRAHDYADF
ncbi:DNA-directed RNA polymerase II core subunit [Tulasnella sp. 419]|nr:DNA-directed RNA polymerase II core subunit [Tulasnella sp. 419]